MGRIYQKCVLSFSTALLVIHYKSLGGTQGGTDSENPDSLTPESLLPRDL